MDESSVVVFAAILITLLLSAFFSGIEIAFISANRLKIAIDNEQGGLQAKILAYFAKKPSWFIGTMLLGNNITVVIYSIYMAEAIDPSIQGMMGLGIGAMLVQTVVATIILLIFAEFLPKAIFRINANSILSALSVPLFAIYVLLFIPTFITIGLAESILKLIVKSDGDDSDQIAFEKVDLDIYLEEGLSAASDEEDQDYEVKIFHNAINFSEVIARDCMVPRNEIVAFELNDSIDDIKQKFIETELSKILIYRETVDNIIGYVHSFEMFKQPESIKEAMLPVSIIPESMTANNILEDLIKKNRSIAVVLDEFGGTAGMITMEDIIEEIFGEIEDEHDFDDIVMDQLNEREFLLGARAEIDFINEKYSIGLPESEEYETLGGFIIHQLEDIPEAGEWFDYEQFKVTIKEVSETKIELVHIYVKEEDI